MLTGEWDVYLDFMPLGVKVSCMNSALGSLGQPPPPNSGV